MRIFCQDESNHWISNKFPKININNIFSDENVILNVFLKFISLVVTINKYHRIISSDVTHSNFYINTPAYSCILLISAYFILPRYTNLNGLEVKQNP